MSVQISYKKQILFGILFLVIFLITLEMIINVYDFFTKTCKFIKSDAFDTLEHDLRMQICYDFQDLKWSRYPELHLETNQHMPTININNDGFRGNEITEDSNGKYRIFVVGGSTVFGSGATSDETTIPGFLQQLFDNSTLNNIQVINAGIPSGDSTTESKLIKNKIIKYDPDLIIVYDGWNDVRTNINDLKDEPILKNSTILEDISNEIKYHVSKYRTLQIIQKYFYYSSTEEWNTRVIYKHDSSDVMDKVEIWEMNWNSICDLSKLKSFDILITIQPIAGSSNRTLTEYEYMKYMQNDNVEMNHSLNLYAESLHKLNCKNVVDIRNVFDHVEGPIFYDEGHVTDRGNLIVSKRLYELALPLISNNNITKY